MRPLDVAVGIDRRGALNFKLHTELKKKITKTNWRVEFL